MGIPKKNLVNVYPPIPGDVEVQKLMDQTDENTTFLPTSISLEDIDMAVNECLNNGKLELFTISNGSDRTKVPVIFMSNERWGEFSKTWKFIDDNYNLVPPFVTLKKNEILKGTYLGERYNIPNKRTFQYLKTPYYEDNSYGYIIYKIPQPTAINLTYDVKLFTRYLVDVNEIAELYFNQFSDRQLYIDVNGHYMQINLEESGSDNTLNDIDGERFYVKTFNLLVKGYILKKSDFEVVKTIRQIKTDINLTNSSDKIETKVGVIKCSIN